MRTSAIAMSLLSYWWHVDNARDDECPERLQQLALLDFVPFRELHRLKCVPQRCLHAALRLRHLRGADVRLLAERLLYESVNKRRRTNNGHLVPIRVEEYAQV